MSRKAHDSSAKTSLKVIIPPRSSDEHFNKLLAQFNRDVEDSRLFEDISRSARFTKKSVLDRQKEFSRRKNIRSALLEKKKLEDKYYNISVTK